MRRRIRKRMAAGYSRIGVHYGGSDETLAGRRWSGAAPEPASPAVQIPAPVCAMDFSQVNSSDPHAFLAFVRDHTEVFEENNIIFSHGGFIRKLAGAVVTGAQLDAQGPREKLREEIRKQL